MILSGWKEIAGYMGRGVRTVQRWEHFGLPVRRPAGHSRSSVAASSDDIDTWLRACGAGDGEVTAAVQRNTETKSTLRAALAQHHSLIEQQMSLRAELKEARHRYESAHASIGLGQPGMKRSA